MDTQPYICNQISDNKTGNKAKCPSWRDRDLLDVLFLIFQTNLIMDNITFNCRHGNLWCGFSVH